MSEERHARLRELFLAACERPAAERRAFLERSCVDEQLRREVESLLSHHGHAETLTADGFEGTPELPPLIPPEGMRHRIQP